VTVKAKTPKRLWKKLENREEALLGAAALYARVLGARGRDSAVEIHYRRELKQAAIEYFRALTACATVPAKKAVGGSKR